MERAVKMYLNLIGDSWINNPDVSFEDKQKIIREVKSTTAFQLWVLGREVRELNNNISKKLDILIKVLNRR